MDNLIDYIGNRVVYLRDVTVPLVRQAQSRRIETPNAVMTTLASPTLGGARTSIWRTEAKPGAKGPVHIFDVEQIWTFLDGEATIELDGEVSTAGAGDTAVLPAYATRQVVAGARGYTAVVTAPADAHAWTPGDADTVAMPGAAANSADSGEGRNKIVPPWVV